MVVIEELADFNAFAADLVRDPKASRLSLSDIYEAWWSARHRDEDLAAIRQSVAEYEQGERGEPAREELAGHRQCRLGRVAGERGETGRQ